MKYAYLFFVLDSQRLSQIVHILYHHRQPLSFHILLHRHPLFLTLPIKSKNEPFFFLFTNKTTNLFLHSSVDVEAHATFFRGCNMHRIHTTHRS